MNFLEFIGKNFYKVSIVKKFASFSNSVVRMGKKGCFILTSILQSSLDSFYFRAIQITEIRLRKQQRAIDQEGESVVVV